MPHKKIDEWEARDAARTLERAEEIKMNKKLLAAADKQLKKEQIATNRAVAAVKRVSRKKRKA